MERRRLAVILSHLSLNTSLSFDKSESHGSGDNEKCSVAVDSHVCNGEDKAGVENVQNVEESSSCAVSMAEVKGLSKSEFNLKDVVHDGAVRSQMTRSQEIVNEFDDNCVFCDIIRGRAPAFKLYEDDTCLCIFDINPLSQGHSLIIPKTHFSSLEVTPPAVAAAMCAIVPLLGNAIMRATCCDSFNLLVNNGASAGQEIFHTHFHIIPRSMNDELWSSQNVRRRPLCLNQETTVLADRIREKLSAQQS